MDRDVFDTKNTAVQMILVLKLQKLQRQSLPSLTYENLVAFIEEGLWKDNAPDSLHEAAKEILAIEPSQIVRYLSKQAILDGAKSKISDFSDVIGGE